MELQRDQIFRTSNAQLAFACFIAGCQPALQADGGPACNVYTRGFLRQPRFKSRFIGRGIVEAAQELIRQGVPGNVTYAIERCAILDEVIAGWDEMAHERQQAHVDERPPEMPDIPPRIVAQVLFVAANSTADFKKLPFLNRMQQLVSTMDGASKKEGEKTTTEGAGVVCSIFGSDETKKHLNV